MCICSSGTYAQKVSVPKRLPTKPKRIKTCENYSESRTEITPIKCTEMITPQMREGLSVTNERVLRRGYSLKQARVNVSVTVTDKIDTHTNSAVMDIAHYQSFAEFAFDFGDVFNLK